MNNRERKIYSGYIDADGCFVAQSELKPESDRQLLTDALNFIVDILKEQSSHGFHGDAECIRRSKDILDRADQAKSVRPRTGTPYYTPNQE
jgi:hypothetical protein